MPSERSQEKTGRERVNTLLKLRSNTDRKTEYVLDNNLLEST